MSNMKKYLTAILYGIMTPLGVVDGYELGAAHYAWAIIITVVLTGLNCLAVVTWMDAQTMELKK